MEERAPREEVPEVRMRRIRITSMVLSITGLLLTLVIMGFGVSLSAIEYSLQKF